MTRTKKSTPGKGKQSKAAASKVTKPTNRKSKAKPSTATRQNEKSQENSRLLGIFPAEVRNQIWREALVSSTAILVNRDEPHQPALLRTCTQIRDEASGIYFFENSFDLPMVGYDSTLGMKWCKAASSFLEQGIRVGFVREAGTETWVDLKVWLQRYRVGQVIGYSSSCYEIGCDRSVEKMFEFMEGLAGKPWKKVEKALDEHKIYLEESQGAYEFGLFDNPGSDC